MPIDAETLAAYIEEHGPSLFHVTDARRREAIMRDGLRAGSELGHFVRDDFFRTRSGHVYICDRLRGVPVVPVDGERMTVQVDLRELDRACFDTDEDVPYVQQQFQGKRWFDVEPPERMMLDSGIEAPGQAGRLAAWAESIANFDEPEFVARSLAAGRVAYRGSILPDALEVVELPSAIIETFVNRARELLRIDDVGAVPALAFSELEADRALSIAQQILEAGLKILDRPRLTTDSALSEPMTAYYLERDIRGFGFEKNRVGDCRARDLAFTLADLARAVHDLDRALGWDPEACIAIAECAASCLPHVATADGNEAAVALFRSAVVAAS